MSVKLRRSTKKHKRGNSEGRSENDRPRVADDVTNEPISRYPVTLHVYEIWGGAYHAAVEVHGKEWQYGAGDGICFISPGSATAYQRHLDPVSMGYTLLTPLQVDAAIEEMKLNWRGDEYNLIHRNCCTFARRFLQELRAQSMPAWVDRWTQEVTPTVEAGVSAVASRSAVLGAELIASRAATLGGARVIVGAGAAGPAAWASAAGDLVGSSIGSHVGGKLGGDKGADKGREVGGFSGSVAMGAGVGAITAGPIGAGIGAGVGVLSWSIGKLVRNTIGEVVSGNLSESSSTYLSDSSSTLTVAASDEVSTNDAEQVSETQPESEQTLAEREDKTERCERYDNVLLSTNMYKGSQPLGSNRQQLVLHPGLQLPHQQPHVMYVQRHDVCLRPANTNHVQRYIVRNARLCQRVQ